MRPHFLFLVPLLLFGCGASQYTTMTEDYREALSTEELSNTAFFVSTRMDFVCLKPGEIVGEDIFKREVKKTILVDPDSAGRVIASGPQWLTVGFNGGVVLTFRWDPMSQAYLTPGWGTVTIQNERFDIKQGVLTGGYVQLLVRKTQ
jgi:hypothetical protein